MDTHASFAGARGATLTTAKTRFGSRLDVVAGLLALALIALLGALKLLMPLGGDQSLFMLYAQELDRGARLYVDIWDVKQPGIFWLYWLAGKTLGFSMLSMHVFDLLWQLAFAALAMVALHRSGYFSQRWLAVLPPAIAVGTYYAIGEVSDISLVEGLIGLPILLTAVLLSRAHARVAPVVLAGLLAGAVVTLKLPYAPLFIVMVLIAAFDTARVRKSAFLAALVRVTLAFAVGVAIVLGAVSVPFLLHGNFNEMVWTSFVYPFAALHDAASHAPAGRFFKSMHWYLVGFAPWLLFAGLGASRLVRRDEPVITRQMIAWIVTGLLLIFAQRLSQWHYQFILVFVPTAVLAVRGIDLLLVRLTADGGQRPVAPALLTAALVLPPLGGIVLAADPNARLLFQELNRGEGVEGYRSAVSPDYGWIAERFPALRAPSPSEPIYVFGNPLVYLVAGRQQALPVHGWAWYMLPQAFWETLPGELAAARPAYVFFDANNLAAIPRVCPKVMTYFDEAYDVVSEDANGRLYARRDPPPDSQVGGQ